MGEIPEPTPEKPVIKFEDLRLSDIQFDKPPEWRDGKNYSGFETTVEFNLDGTSFSLMVDKTEQNDDSGNVTFNFLVCRDSEEPRYPNESHLLFASVGFTSISADSGVVESNIARKGSKNAERLLPKGFGIAMYGKMLDLIQYQANRKQKNFLHVITREENAGMAEDKWYKVFARFLSDKGYKMLEEEGDKKFQKMYLPQERK